MRGAIETNPGTGGEDPHLPLTDSAVEQTNTPVLRRLSVALNDSLRIFFARLGRSVARHPRLTILLTLAFAGLCSSGCARFSQETRGDRLWLPQNTEVALNEGFVKDVYGSRFRVTTLIYAPEQAGAHGTNLATREELLALAERVRVVEQVAGKDSSTSGGPVTLDDVCLNAAADLADIHICTMNSVLDLFVDPAAYVPGETYTDAAVRGIRALSDRQIKERIENGPYHTWNGLPLEKDQLVGNLSGTGATFRVGAIVHKFVLRSNLTEISPGVESDTAAEAWEEAARGLVSNGNADGFYLITHSELMSAIEDSLKGELKWFAIGYVSLVAYIVFTMGEFGHGVRSRTLLGFGALFSVGLALVSTVGVSSLFGIFYGPVHAVLPVLLLGLGADDAFVLVRTYDSMTRNDPTFLRSSAEDRVTMALASSGSAILITSATNSFVFFFSAITPIPALSTFSLWAGLGVLFDFFFSVTFLVALFYYDIVRQDARRFDLIPCMESISDKDINCLGISPGLLSRLLSKQFGNFLMRDSVRSSALVAFTALFGVMVYGTTQLQVAFAYRDFYKTNSVQDHYEVVFAQYFQPTYPVAFYTRAIAHEEPGFQASLKTFCDPANGTAAVNEFIEDGTVDCWLTSLLDANNGDATQITGDLFFPALQTFLQSRPGSRFERHLICHTADQQTVSCSSTAAVKLFSSRFSANIRPPKNSLEEVDSLKNVIRMANESDVESCFAHGPVFVFWEWNSGIIQSAILLLTVSLAVVLVVTSLLIGNPVVAGLVLISISLSVTLVLGVMHFWNESLNIVTMINLCVAVGLTVDASVHIGRSFVEHAGDRKDRVKLALGDVGPAVVHGCISTVLGIVFLGLSASYIFQIFFRCLFTVLVSALCHGLVFLPCMLSFLGPPGLYEEEADRIADEKDILRRRNVLAAEDESSC